MYIHRPVATARTVAAPALLFLFLLPRQAPAQHMDHPMEPEAGHQMQHGMFRLPLGDWHVVGMGQVFPVVTTGGPDNRDGGELRRTEWYLTQPALMTNLESPSRRLVLRTTLNFEGITLGGGELTYGGWGEGFIDKRHPHTLLHEAMLSWNLWEVAGGGLSLSAGKGFAPYGTDDPMSRPGLKYPTNHHLSQVLERWTVNAIWRLAGWSLEAGVFGGTEPEGPYDFSNIRGFPDSWSGRLTRRWTSGTGSPTEWETSFSRARVTESHDGHEETSSLSNAALRRSGPAGPGMLYGLVEGSRSEPERGQGYTSVLAETGYAADRHQPYLRLEFATRPEYARTGPAGSDDFFRYDHGAHATGATRWLIATAAYARQLSPDPVSLRPFLEVQYHRVRAERGDVPQGGFPGRDSSFWVLSLGARLFLGGGPMRMGSYGVLDPMTMMGRMMAG
ncbi:MAG: hypothetical protein F4X12_10220 [Acidobacteriia bacterium]|nr:hypothetical protein [Terriglobia bacterium]